MQTERKRERGLSNIGSSGRDRAAMICILLIR